jgi:hypothetical protein
MTLPATGGVLSVDCPKCGAAPGEACRDCNPRNVHTRRVATSIKAESAARVAALKFSAAGLDVKQGSLTVARAVSGTMAQRMANALNRYTPGDRGK